MMCFSCVDGLTRRFVINWTMRLSSLDLRPSLCRVCVRC